MNYQTVNSVTMYVVNKTLLSSQRISVIYFPLEVLNDCVMILGNKLEKKTSCEEMLDKRVLCCIPRDLFVVMT